ncbi:putative calcium/calmodulin dependent protein kinase [Aspergillus novoparasiticus]|uniref:Putative calcium/calmodulin dependent protein kinase n=1 Tax=Aspergillus novoparasiticus TaxID=986946 RepID=A0A5N6EFR6_9EURO|nr:putative calcium/calmodulin dependent protein kinase [Aspergillus novoparasiticus]
MFRRAIAKMASSSNLSVGATGSRYRFKQLIQGRPHVGRVWLATSGQDQFILRDIPKDIFSNFNEKIRPQLVESPYIRLPWDNIPDERILAYRYLTDDFLNLVREGIPIYARKQILKTSLRGITELHDQQITIIEHVRIIDLENAAHLPKGRCIKGMLAGNDNWGSPEAHFKGELNKPTDMFSFAIVCIYAILGRVIFGPNDDFRKHEAQGEGLNGLMKHIGDDKISCQVLQMLWQERHEEHIPYRLFSE